VLQVTIEDVRNFSKRMLERENQADNLLSEMKGVFKQVESMKEYCNEMNTLNEIVSNNQSRSALIHSIRQEDRYIMQLSQENKELRIVLEEQQNVVELIMSKYREQVAKLIGKGQNVNTLHQTILQTKVEGSLERVYEMAMVMKNAALLEEQESQRTAKVIAALDIENKTLRELLKISATYGSLPPPQKCDANTQTESPESLLNESLPNEILPNESPPNGSPSNESLPRRKRKHLDTIKLNPLFQETPQDVSSDVSSDEEMSKTSDSIQTVISADKPETVDREQLKNHQTDSIDQKTDNLSDFESNNIQEENVS